MSVTNRSSRFSLIAAGVIAVGYTAYAIVITPSAHDYGDVAVGGALPFDFSFTESGAPATDIASVAITGADPDDFIFEDSTTQPGFPTTVQSCYTPRDKPCEVSFRPKSFGPKQAKLVIKNTRGETATAVLKGKGVRAICENLVVFCNYAFLYDGVFSWSHVITSPTSKTTEEVTVTILHGRGTCNGSETIAENGRSQTGGITGTGLVAVEFVTEPLNDKTTKDEPVYRITVACPTPGFNRTEDSEGSPSQPAELGHNDESTLNIKGVPIGSDLIGRLTYPAPETDAANGVGGNVTIAWKLTYSTNAKPSILSK